MFAGMTAVPLRAVLIVVPLAGLAAGFAARMLGAAEWSGPLWAASAVPVLIVLIAEIWTSLCEGKFGLDIVAALSMSAALIFGEHLAAAIVALMYAGGQYLESFAERRARREMSALLSRVPRTAMCYRDGGLEEVAIDAIVPGDRLLIRRGDVVPVDGQVANGLAVLDQSALTGEALPVQMQAGDAVLSGVTNVGEVFDLSVSRRAAESTYAAIVRLVEAAQGSRAPMVRIADRFALVFLAVTIVMAGGAWFLTGDPIRAVAVLVVATPCPLILAVPVAIVAGLSRAARHGILVKSGGALEMMARVRALVIDKTGTLTSGEARVTAVRVAGRLSADEILRLAGSLDQASKHVVAQTLVAYARGRGFPLALPTNVTETPGEGIEGEIEGRRVVVGGRRFVAAKVQAIPRTAQPRRHSTPGVVTVSVACDGVTVGEIVLADELRTEAAMLLASLRRFGVDRIVLATGDRQDVAAKVASGLDIDAVRAELSPDQKVLVVLSERKNGPVMMVGDGVNDAPALAAADVGLAMGARGAAASAEAADVVLLVDQIDRIAPAISIARRSRRIALESVVAGIGLSVGGMMAAAFGYLTPVQGALFQEVIDVAVILNALRALRGHAFVHAETPELEGLPKAGLSAAPNNPRSSAGPVPAHPSANGRSAHRG
ncbi:MAG: cation transporter [Alphaproteobacteria bacterium]|nr:MAG: cation transporter [Alphaproteobacteria bacterium]